METTLGNELSLEEINLVIEEYERFMDLQREYFCVKAYVPATETTEKQEVISFSNERYAQNKEFVSTWPERKKIKMEKIKTGKYTFSKGNGRRRDEMALAKNNHKYSDLLEYFTLEDQFNRLKEVLGEENSVEEHIKLLREIKSKLETEKRPRKAKKRASESTESQKEQ